MAYIEDLARIYQENFTYPKGVSKLLHDCSCASKIVSFSDVVVIGFSNSHGKYRNSIKLHGWAIVRFFIFKRYSIQNKKITDFLYFRFTRMDEQYKFHLNKLIEEMNGRVKSRKEREDKKYSLQLFFF